MNYSYQIEGNNNTNDIYTQINQANSVNQVVEESSGICDPTEVPEKYLSKMQSEVYPMNQEQKSFLSLENKYKNLSNDYNLASKQANRREFELMKKIEQLKQTINEMNAEKEDFLIEIKNLKIKNSEVFNDNMNICKIMEQKDADVNMLKQALKEKDNLIQQLTEENNNFKNEIQLLTNDKIEHDSANQKIQETNLNNLHVIEELQNNLNLVNQEFIKVKSQLERSNIDNQQLSQNLEFTKQNLSNTQEELASANKVIIQLDQGLKEKENELDETKNDIKSNLKDLKDQQYAQMNFNQQTWKEYENEMTLLQFNNQKLIQELNALKIEHEKTLQDKNHSEISIEHFKKYIMTLTKENQKLAKFLKEILVRDVQIDRDLNATERIKSVLQNNQVEIENELDKLDEGIM